MKTKGRKVGGTRIFEKSIRLLLALFVACSSFPFHVGTVSAADEIEPPVGGEGEGEGIETPVPDLTADPTAEPTAGPACYPLTLIRSGEGADPWADPSGSEGCAAGEYVAGELIALGGAEPAEGWGIAGWQGTDDDAALTGGNALAMPERAWTAGVVYALLEVQVKDKGEKGMLAQDAGIESSSGWTAYNDVVWASGQLQSNITQYTTPGSGTTSGVLINYDTGNNTGVSVSITSNPTNLQRYTTNGANTNSGTDAYNSFNGKVSLVGVINYGSTSGWWVDITFTELDSSKTYTFATTANRDNSSYTNRQSRFTISDVDAATNASSQGVPEYQNSYSVYFSTGYNTVNGYVARWTGIQPGSNGSFKVRVQAHDINEAYGPSVFMLQEEPSTGPSITTSGALAAFSSQPGVASAEQSYTVSGSNLSEDLVITAPADFQVATASGGPFSSSVSLTPAGGEVAATPIYVRFLRATEGTSSGNITQTSAGADAQNVAVSGTALNIYTLTAASGGNGSVALNPAGGSYNSGTVVTLTPTADSGYAFSHWSGADAADIIETAGVYTILMNGNKSVSANFVVSLCTDVSLVAVADTRLRSSQASMNYGGETTFQVSPYSSYPQNALIAWDLSSIPAEANVTDASLTVYVTESSAIVFSLYNMRRAWVEGTNTGQAGSGASWTYYGAGTGTWGTAGATNTSSDRYNTNLWDANASVFGQSGSVTIPLNASGISAVQGWVNTPAANFGMTVQYTGSSTSSQDYWIVASKEATTEANRPKLNVTYCVAPSGPTITTDGELDTFSSQPGVASAEQSYTVSGSSLTADISITAPADFQVSKTSGSGFGSSVSLAAADGTVESTPIYVRFLRSTEGTSSGNITHESTDADTKTVPVSGTALNIYTLTADSGGNGSVTLDPAGGSYNSGTVVTLTPEPVSGYKFASWTGADAADIIETAGVYTILMNGHKSVTANFTLIPQYTLTTSVSPQDGGSVGLNPAGGTYDEGTQVTLTAQANPGFVFFEWAGSLTGSANPALVTMDGDKIIEAIFIPDSSCTTLNLTAMEDTYLSANGVLQNNGGNTSLHVDNTTGTSRRTALLKWDVSSIPAGATISSVGFKLNVSDASTLVFNLYNMRRGWVEGTSTQADSSTSANWNTYDGVNSWGTVGAASTTEDRYDTNLWNAGTTTFSTTGSKTVALNSEGVAVVQGWVNGTLANHGLILQNYTGSTANAMFFRSSEYATAADRPILVVEYCTAGVVYTLDVGYDANGSVTVDPVSETYPYGSLVTLTPVPYSGYEFAYWSGADDEDPSDNGDGTWSIIMDSNKSIVANFSLLPINLPPNQPVLVQPADDSAGITMPPDLEVTVSDDNPTDLTLDVDFYGRQAGSSAGDDFTLIAIPDTQNHAASAPNVMYTMFQWIANQKAARDIVFATSMGDIVNTASSTAQWTVADTAYDYLDAADVWYNVGPGNHDIWGLYSTYFGSSRFAGKPYYQGYYTSGLDNYNNYSFFSASGNDFIIINLEYSASTAALNWADGLLKAYPNRRGIVIQHDILNVDNSWRNQAPYTALKDNPNLFLMLCGHMHTATDGSAYRAEKGDDGHTIHILMTDYQDYDASNNTGYLRILRFSPANDKIYAQVYSPYTNGYLTNAANYEQFEMAYDLSNGSESSFEKIGSDTGVPNGGNASISWEGLSNLTEYEWYAVVSDGEYATTGPTWSFTTGITVTNQPPVLDPLVYTPLVNELVLMSFTATASDPDAGDILTFSLVGAPDGAAINASSGAFTWTPTEVQGPGTYPFTVKVCDNGTPQKCDEEAISVTVSEVNVAPVLAGIGNKNVNELALLSFTASATDADIPANTLTYTLEGAPTGAAIHASTGAFTWTPAEDQGPGTYPFTVKVCDNGSPQMCDDELITVTVNEVNQAPALATIGSRTVNELVEMSFTATATDGDIPANTLTFSLVNEPDGASITSGGYFTWTPAEFQGPGSYPFTVKVCDNGSPSLCDDELITVTVNEVNQAPVLAAIGNKSVEENNELAFTASATDGDIPANALAFSLVGAPAGASITSGGAFTWTPAATGDFTFTVKVCDDGTPVLCDEEEITVTVTPSGPVPPLPSTFHGEIHILDNPPTVGGTVQAFVAGVETPVASATITDASGELYYSIIVPGDDPATGGVVEGATEGGVVTFKIGTRVVARGEWHSGTMVQLDFHPPQAIPGGPYSGAVGVAVQFSAAANDDGHDVATYEWDWDNDGTYDEVGANASHTWDSIGTRTVGLKVTDEQGGEGIASVEVVISKGSATVTLSNLSHTYDGMPKSASATTVPTGLTVTFTYGGSPTQPVNAGSYEVVATIVDDNYQGSASGTLVIAKATAAVVLSDLIHTYNGNEKEATVTTTPAGLSHTVTYNGGSAKPVNAGDYTVVATITDPNYEGSDTQTLTIAKATATVTLGGLSQVYDGTEKPVTATTVPAGLAVEITYGGSPTPPTLAGSYEVVATIVDDNYQGGASGTLEILAKHDIALVAGWNLVSFAVNPVSTAIEDVLSSIEGSYDLVYAWDASGATENNWLKYDNVPASADNLEHLEARMGFWIHMTAADTLEVIGSVPASTAISIYNGWNLVGYPSGTAGELPGTLSGLGTNFSLVYSYRANDGLDPWKLFDRTGPAYANDLADLQPGWGYWLRASADGTWTVSY